MGPSYTKGDIIKCKKWQHAFLKSILNGLFGLLTNLRRGRGYQKAIWSREDTFYERTQINMMTKGIISLKGRQKRGFGHFETFFKK